LLIFLIPYQAQAQFVPMRECCAEACAQANDSQIRSKDFISEASKGFHDSYNESCVPMVLHIA